MARHANTNWNLDEGTPTGNGGSTHQWPSIHAALLMDLRDELQRLNALLHCANFQAIPGRLKAIQTNTTKRKYTRKAAK
jgi:hypothetical protein